MKKVVFATQNRDKLHEIKEHFAGTEYEICAMGDIGLDLDIEEDGTTFSENAFIKARALYKALQERKAGGDAAAGEFYVMADDSGFEVDYLNGEPGIYSARYMGRETPYSIKNQAIIDKLEGIPEEERSARFWCAIACICPDGSELLACEPYEGRVAHEAKGEFGFGYDPIFFVPEMGCNDAELPLEIKNKISHRGKALKKIRAMLEKD